MRRSSCKVSLALAVAAAATVGPAPRAELSWYEWSAIAPIVVSARGIGENGRFTEVRVEEVLRGDLSPGSTLRLDVRRANRQRSEHSPYGPIRLDTRGHYLLLLKESDHSRKRRDAGVHDLVRGVAGARELPDEGATAHVDALRRLLSLQGQSRDSELWNEMAALLEEQNPILVQTALEQFTKFRRGNPALIDSFLRLMEHPAPQMRTLSAGLIAQTVDRFGPERLSDPARARSVLVARARRDDVVEVRIAATEALARLGGAATDRVLEEIAEDDPDQTVRYTAQRILFQKRRTEARNGPGDRLD